MKENMRYDPMYYQLREGTVQRILEIIRGNQHCQKGGIVFLGDSLIQFYQMKNYLRTTLSMYNCGIEGYTSKELLLLIDEAVFKYEPSIIFIHIGTNDLGDTLMRSPREIALWLLRIADVIHHNLPQSQIVLLSPLPCIERLQSYMTLKKGLRCNETLHMIYEEVEKLLPMEGVKTLDIFQCVLDGNGNPCEALYEDGLHLNSLGYEKISVEIQQYLDTSHP